MMLIQFWRIEGWMSLKISMFWFTSPGHRVASIAPEPDLLTSMHPWLLCRCITVL